MVAPTALRKASPAPTASSASPSSKIIGLDNTMSVDDDDDDILIDTENTTDLSGIDSQTKGSDTNKNTFTNKVVLDESGKPRFQDVTKQAEAGLMKIKLESRKIPVPPHRMTPLKNNWTKIYPPLVDHLKLQVRMNLKTKSVEMKTNPKFTTDPGALQKGADFIKAFTLGFDLDDSIALLRLDDLYIETFEIKDVKTLNGDHLSRAIGRIAGKDGKTKFAIENATRTRIVLADSKIHILGGFTHIRMARESVVSLILGSPPGKVYGNLRTVASRLKERY